MMCPKCGAYISDDATFCPQCGMTIYENNPDMRTANQGGAPQPVGGGNNNNNRGLIILICSIAAAVLFVVLVTFGFLLMSGNSPFGAKETPAPTPVATPTPEPTPTPAPAPAPTPQIVYVPQPQPETNPNPVQQYRPTGYNTFRSDKYNFSCEYPAGFIPYDDGGTLTLYTLRSPDGQGTEKIVAKPNEGETVGSSSADFLASHPGTITYESVGSDYYAYSVLSGSTETYRYCKFAKGNLYWFEFSYPYSQLDVYDTYINDIYGSFSY